MRRSGRTKLPYNEKKRLWGISKGGRAYNIIFSLFVAVGTTILLNDACFLAHGLSDAFGMGVRRAINQLLF